jgi:pimeloyl-[acyl-carrier protein] methyl ester esterase
MARLALILLPGIDGSGVLFEPLVSLLPASIHPIVVAFPPDRELRYAELLELVRAAIPAHVPYLILGESFSGPLALLAAHQADSWLCGIVLCATFVENPVWWLPSWVKPRLPTWLFRFYGAAARLKAYTSGFNTPALQRLLRRAFLSLRPKVLATRVQEIFSVNVAPELQACPVPILYLRGEYDNTVPERSLKIIQQLRPAVQVARLAAAHPLLQTHSAEAARCITEFIERTLPKMPSADGMSG